MESFWFHDEGAAGDNARSGDGSHDSSNPSRFSAAEYIKQNGDRLDSQRFPAMRLAGDVREIVYVRTGVCVTLPFAPGLSGGDTGADAVQPTRCVILARRTVRMFVVLRNSCTRDA